MNDAEIGEFSGSSGQQALEQILEEGDSKVVTAQTIARLRNQGALSDKELERLYGNE